MSSITTDFSGEPPLERKILERLIKNGDLKIETEDNFVFTLTFTCDDLVRVEQDKNVADTIARWIRNDLLDRWTPLVDIPKSSRRSIAKERHDNRELDSRDV